MKVVFCLIFLFMISATVPGTTNGFADGKEPELFYLVREPIMVSPKPPVLILLHGVGSNEEDLFGLAGELPKEMLILSLRAPITLSAGSYAWYRLDYNNGIMQYDSREAEAARLAIARFIEQAKAKYKTGDVYLMGFSQGTIMSYSVALTRPDLVKGVLALSGRMLDETKKQHAKSEALKSLQVFSAHGTKDPVLTIAQGKDAVSFCRSLHVPIVFREYPMAHEVCAAELKDLATWLNERLHPKH